MFLSRVPSPESTKTYANNSDQSAIGGKTSCLEFQVAFYWARAVMLYCDWLLRS